MGYSLGEGKSLVASKGSWKVGKCEKHKFRQGCGIIMSRSSGVKKSNLMRPEHRLMQARTWLVIGWEGRLRLFMVLGWLWLWSKGNGTYCWSRRKIPRYQSRDQPEGYCSNFKKKRKKRYLFLIAHLLPGASWIWTSWSAHGHKTFPDVHILDMALFLQTHYFSTSCSMHQQMSLALPSKKFLNMAIFLQFLHSHLKCKLLPTPMIL